MRAARPYGAGACVAVSALVLGCGRSYLDLAAESAPADAGSAPASVDAGPPAPRARAFQSCDVPGPGIDDCGPSKESCCTSLPVPAGKFIRSYDGVSCPGGPSPAPPPALGCYLSTDHWASVSAFRLDKYLVTVARFKAFLASIRASGWRPAEGDGRHVHLNGGRGLVEPDTGETEAGWSAAWNDDTLALDPGDNDNTVPEMSINGITWAQAYAFCIWDGGFLPSEAEWNYAASGGEEQRVYPWSSPPQDTTVDCAHAAYTGMLDPDACVASTAFFVGAKSPAGDGRWGQADLAGLRAEWTLDWLADYLDPCVDCATLRRPAGAVVSRAVRGYSHVGAAAPPHLLTSVRGDDSYGWNGFRCARSP
ncbi:MAG TPA: SUMF1/EgtB/PvdO family nonheme iron enzyme [Polyangia bacterium]|nr:SUMF1/EgtB/PvdO family nonheme iron enzyme [Polyangia bacterium]